jgi:hypothetical protein
MTQQQATATQAAPRTFLMDDDEEDAAPLPKPMHLVVPKDMEMSAYARIGELKLEVSKLEAELKSSKDVVLVQKAEINKLQAMARNLEAELLKSAGVKTSLAEMAAKDNDLRTFPDVDESLGGVAAQAAAKVLYMELKRAKGQSPSAIRSFSPGPWTSQIVFNEQVLVPDTVFVAPHLREKPGQAIRCPCELGPKASPHAIKCVGVKSAKTVFGPNGPKLWITFGYECYKTKTALDGGGVEVLARHRSDDMAFAAKNFYDHELRQYVVSKEYVFEHSLVESLHFLYTSTPCTIESICQHYRAVYARVCYSRVDIFLQKLQVYLGGGGGGGGGSCVLPVG